MAGNNPELSAYSGVILLNSFILFLVVLLNGISSYCSEKNMTENLLLGILR